ncbi:DUF6471 domain-containing protein [Roseateles cavernae]|uniref:DUF6471 domain-containing protein n=1 Tax=Roseateles cavernae TaxID=3153578 RepID=UPI003D80B503
MQASHDWSDAASRLLRGELARKGFTLRLLAERLQALGLEETEGSVKSKLHRGTFSASFLLQCMTVLGRNSLELEGIIPAHQES